MDNITFQRLTKLNDLITDYTKLLDRIVEKLNTGSVSETIYTKLFMYTDDIIHIYIPNEIERDVLEYIQTKLQDKISEHRKEFEEL